MDKGFKWTFLRRRQQTHGKVLNLTNYQQNENHKSIT